MKDTFGDRLPDGFTQRPRWGFSAPISTMLRRDLFAAASDYMLGNVSLGHLFKKGHLLTLSTERSEGSVSHSEKVWALMVLAQRFQNFKLEL